MQISKHVAYGAVVAFLVLFGTVFYLLGRESSRRKPGVASANPTAPPTETVAATAPPSPPTAVPAPPMPSAIPGAPASLPAAAAGAAPRTPSAGPAIALAPTPLMPSAPPAADGPAAARDYFLRIQAIQSIGPTGDTSEFANQLLASSMTGDGSGFDELIKTLQAGAERANAISPPPCCIEYHQHLLSMISESVDTMKRLKGAIARGDSEALLGMAASGSSLQTRAAALEDEARHIKARFGLAN